MGPRRLTSSMLILKAMDFCVNESQKEKPFKAFFACKDSVARNDFNYIPYCIVHHEQRTVGWVATLKKSCLSPSKNMRFEPIFVEVWRSWTTRNQKTFNCLGFCMFKTYRATLMDELKPVSLDKDGFSYPDLSIVLAVFGFQGKTGARRGDKNHFLTKTFFKVALSRLKP